MLNDDLRERIRACFPRYPNRRAVVLPALHLVQQRLGYVPTQAVVEIAEILELAPAEVQDTLSFYGFFKQDRPAGVMRVWVCRSISCSCRGSEELLEQLSAKLGVRPGETSADGRVTLETAECLGAYDFAPAMLVGDTLHPCMNKEKVEQFVGTVERIVVGERPAP